MAHSLLFNATDRIIFYLRIKKSSQIVPTLSSLERLRQGSEEGGNKAEMQLMAAINSNSHSL